MSEAADEPEGEPPAKKKPAANKRPPKAIAPPPSTPTADDIAAGEREETQTYNRTDHAISRETRRLRNEKLKLQNERLRIGNTQRTWNNRMRLAAAFGIFFVVLFWLGGVFALVWGQQGPVEHRLTDTVMVALLVTSSLNVIGLLRIVAVYLFPTASVTKGGAD